MDSVSMETMELPYVELIQKFKELENKYNRIKNREFVFLSKLPEIVFILDLQERFIFLNDTCLNKFLLTKDDLDNGLYLKDILSPESHKSIQELYRINRNADTFHANELTGIRHDGSKFPLTIYISKLVNHFEYTGFVGIGFDISSRKEIENKLLIANQSKAEFFSIIAHDLKNPFNSLVGFSQLLLSNFNNYNSDKIREYIEYMAKAANQGYLLLENLLEWSRSQTGNIDYNPVSFDIMPVIMDNIQLIQISASQKGIKINLKVSGKTVVNADQNMIETIIRNLLSNAVKFTHRNGIINVNLSRKPVGFNTIEVIDDGIGIKKDRLKKLFDIDSKQSTPGTEKEHGTGLGLILCKEFAKLNNGDLQVESEPGKGSKFRVMIPASK